MIVPFSPASQAGIELHHSAIEQLACLLIDDYLCERVASHAAYIPKPRGIDMQAYHLRGHDSYHY